MNSVEHMVTGILQKKKIKKRIVQQLLFIPADSQSTSAFISVRSPK